MQKLKTIKYEQLESFPDEYGALTDTKSLLKKSKLMKLNPKVDDDGV